MQKFENIDLVSALERIMKTNTEYYQTDFNYDKSILQRAANSNKTIDKSLLWLSRKHGTNCVFESDAYIKNSPSNTTWKYFDDQKSENVLSYALTVTEIKDGRIYGNLYELDYAEHIRNIRKNQVKADDQIIHFEHGDIKTDFGKMPSASDKLGEPVEVEYIPNEPEKLESVLKHQQEERKKLPAGDIEKYLSSFDIKARDMSKRNDAESLAAELHNFFKTNIPDYEYIFAGIKDKQEHFCSMLMQGQFTSINNLLSEFGLGKADHLINRVAEHIEKYPMNLYYIYQVKDDCAKYMFMSYDWLKKQGETVNKDNYNLVYASELTPADTPESIYREYNLNKPADFRGHSLSVSDIVVFSENGKKTAYYCDSIGFTKVPEFLSEKKPSIRKQLAKNKEKTADVPKKPSKNKTKDLEV